MTLTSNTQNKSSCFYQKNFSSCCCCSHRRFHASSLFCFSGFRFPVSGFRFPNLKVNFVGGLISRVATSEHLQDQPRFYGGCIPKKLDRFKNQISVVKWSVFLAESPKTNGLTPVRLQQGSTRWKRSGGRRCRHGASRQVTLKSKIKIIFILILQKVF